MDRVKNIIASIRIEHVNLILILCIIVYLLNAKSSEHMTDTGIDTTTDAINNIASLYNKEMMIVDNLTVKGKITAAEVDAPTVKATTMKTDKIDVDDEAKAKYFILNGGTIDPKKVGTDGIFCRDNGQATIYGDDHIVLKGPKQSFDLHVSSDDLKVNNKTLYLERYAPYNEIAGFLIDGGGTTLMIQQGKHSLITGIYGMNNGFVENAVDTIYLYRGWKIKVWRDDFAGTSWETSNTSATIKEWKGFDANQISSYEATWIGY